jgi:hypothetical protein
MQSLIKVLDLEMPEAKRPNQHSLFYMKKAETLIKAHIYTYVLPNAVLGSLIDRVTISSIIEYLNRDIIIDETTDSVYFDFCFIICSNPSNVEKFTLEFTNYLLGISDQHDEMVNVEKYNSFPVTERPPTVTISFYTRVGNQKRVTIRPCCGKIGETCGCGFITHRGKIVEMITSRASAAKNKEIAVWSCCQMPILVKNSTVEGLASVGFSHCRNLEE